MRKAKRPVTERDGALDILRALGLLLIVLAHCEPPPWLFQLRNFNVLLMVMVSAMTFARWPGMAETSPLSFYKKRLYCLIVPAWIFLTVYFGLISAYAALADRAFPYSVREIVSSYALHKGIGYVWVLKIFVIVALATPPLLFYKKHVSDSRLYFGGLLAAYAAYELFAYLNAHMNDEPLSGRLNQAVLLGIPYVLVYALGLKMGEMRLRTLAMLSAGLLAVFAVLAWWYWQGTGSFVQTQAAKYPPTLYYLSYGLGMAILCCAAVRRFGAGGSAPRLLAWISRHGLWIYLWHIMALYVWNETAGKAEGILWLSLTKYAFVIVSSCLIVAAQTATVSRVLRDRAGRAAELVRAALA